MFWYKGTTYATMWEARHLTNADGYSVSFSTSEKRQDTGEYVNSNWNGVAFKEAADVIGSLKRGDRFIIKTAKLEVRSYEKDGVKYFPTNVVLIDIEPANPENSSKNTTKRETSSTSSRAKAPDPVPDEDDEDSPW